MKLFTSATWKLAGWYLLILMTVSLLFSGIIFSVARAEVDTRLRVFMNEQIVWRTDKKESPDFDGVTTSLLVSLAYLNAVVLLGGGVIAYILARRTLEPIEAAHEAQSRFVANASHQLRTPLAIMKAESELTLQSPRASKADLRQTLESNLEEVNRLNELATMLLELSRSECELNSSTEKFDLTQLTTTLVQSRPGADRVTISAPDTLRLTLHRPAVREIVAILLDNAFKHSPKRSPITVTLHAHKTTAHIAITNRGAGIEPADLPHIFERFYRGQERRDSYGLGLSLARQLTKALGGQLTATSTPGKTTTFTLIVPKR